ncbi:dipeptide/oligopeptide/nickel ABC transporter permease/ATP-binding protein [Streptosporangium carneum]|uniref:Peptide ABC transporter ATP-binding protein n=1 Tax=Streptosporangium carneum TaxID=47481 RepID=A0A9W6MCW1_9ACTN|nr:dipeptide/oligopeptide/nickel ABC transporter permease/ATP-binding protein [Streptosporangium carneum]GLK09581.1 peptide ABC transporter ATP-binding protein [Streptosporangium carneum]
MTALTGQAVPQAASAPERRGGRRAFRSTVVGPVALGVLAVLAVVALVAPVLGSGPAVTVRAADAVLGPSAEHWLGTDRLGRDVLVRTLVATRTSLLLGLGAAAVAALGGVILGGAVAAAGPRTRSAGLRVLDAVLAFPAILVAILATLVLPQATGSAAVAVGVAGAPGVARIVVTLAMTVLVRDHVAAARGFGVGRIRVFVRHVVPNMADSLAVSLSVVAGMSLVVVSSLSFLGAGVQPPAYDWGGMLSQGVRDLYVTPLVALAPAVMIALAGLAFGLLGEALARVANPSLWTTGDAGRDRRARAASGAEGAADEAPDDISEGPALLDVRGLTVTVDGSPGSAAIVSGVDLRVGRGEILGLVGESGSGKSMTMLAVARLLPYPVGSSADTLTLDGRDLRSDRPRELRRLLGTGLALVFQNPAACLNPALKLGVQLTEAPRAHRGADRARARELALAGLRDVRIPEPERRLRQYPHELSGGQRQRATIAMALVTAPGLLLADEPTTALDNTLRRGMLDLLRDVNTADGTAIVLVSHDLSVVGGLCHRIAVMYAGRIVEEGPTAEVMATPKHPYTRALLDSSLTMTTDLGRPVPAIDGQPPRPGEGPPGCAFAPRCALAEDRCARTRPVLREVPGGRKVACWVDEGSLA